MFQSYIIQYFWVPILLGGINLFINNRQLARLSTALFFLSSLFYLYLLHHSFDLNQQGYQFYIKHDWIAFYDIYYELGIDGLSLPLIYLSLFCSWIILFWQYCYERETFDKFSAQILILTGLLIGFFSAVDLVLFYVLFEAMLIPMYLLILKYGSNERVYAAKKFFLYTFFGSVFLFLALCIVGTYSLETSEHSVYSMLSMQQLPLSSTHQLFIGLAILISMGVKVPLWPVHSWLFHAHVQAPTSGSVLLAAVLLKVGGYGLIRIFEPLSADMALTLAPYLVSLGAFAIVYIGFVAFVQEDMKRLIAYSSIAHMGFVTVGIAVSVLVAKTQPQYQQIALNGAYFQMISHGLISAALFFSVGVMYKRVHSRQIADYGGLAQVMPKFCAFFVFFAMANCGLPGTSGFIGEALVIFATFAYSPVLAVIIGLSLVMSAVFSLYLVKRLFFGKVTHQHIEDCEDIDGLETLLFTVLLIGVLFLGIYPHSVLAYLP